jgi:ZIP family zinc transporter
MLESLEASGPIVQALVATIGTYLLTAIGTLPVLFVGSAPRRLMDAMMGFAAGVMVAASCWSLLVPAIALGGVLAATVGLLAGAAFLSVASAPLMGDASLCRRVGIFRTWCRKTRGSDRQRVDPAGSVSAAILHVLSL